VKKLRFFCLSSFSILLFAACGSLHDETIWNTQRPAAQAIPLGALTPGIYTGIGSGGFYGDVSIELTINNDGDIADISVSYSNETPDFADPAFANLIPSVIAAQSANVDVYTGATMTSNAFLNAVRDALLQAGESETISFNLTSGNFVGVGSGGFYGDIHVEITIDDTLHITNIEVIYSNETPSFADPAFSSLIPSVIAAQSANVDVYTGATMTSQAFLQAIANAIMQAAE